MSFRMTLPAASATRRWKPMSASTNRSGSSLDFRISGSSPRRSSRARASRGSAAGPAPTPSGGGGAPRGEQQAPLDHLREQLGVGSLEIGAVALADLEQAEHVQRLERLPHERAADPERFGKAPFRREPPARLDFARQEVVE